MLWGRASFRLSKTSRVLLEEKSKTRLQPRLLCIVSLCYVDVLHQRNKGILYTEAVAATGFLIFLREVPCLFLITEKRLFPTTLSVPACLQRGMGNGSSSPEGMQPPVG